MFADSKRIRDYAGHDSELRAIVSELERDSTEVASPMPAKSLKEMHFRSYAASRMRMPDGKAFRRSQ